MDMKLLMRAAFVAGNRRQKDKFDNWFENNFDNLSLMAKGPFKLYHTKLKCFGFPCIGERSKGHGHVFTLDLCRAAQFHNTEIDVRHTVFSYDKVDIYNLPDYITIEPVK